MGTKYSVEYDLKQLQTDTRLQRAACFTWRSSTNAFKRMDWNHDSLQRPRDSLWPACGYAWPITSVQFSIRLTCQLDDADQILVVQSCGIFTPRTTLTSC